ncbi:MAG: sn-glycerol-1-phosphate dehydrogenase [Treponema sp.]|jgi:glycerol-1-phosphate dehydrogenase [NAD(P)+]|nr:sn-glycerol-1-phosphate dehydrogenase [Treponema sp.]
MKAQTIPTLAECLAAADQTRALVTGENCYGDLPGLLQKQYGRDTVYITADGSTWKAAGEKAKKILEEAGIRVAGVHIFPAEPRLHAEYYNIKTLIQAISSIPDHERLVPVAAGAGTVNDLLKRAAFELKLPYLCLPTAASVDGYTAFGASILMDGFKQTIPCTAPLSLAADTAVLAEAPAYLSSSGFGDLASKIIAGSDWILADEAGRLGAPDAHAINETAWNMTQPGLMDYLHRSVNAAKGDRDAVNALFEALAITGFSMQHMKNSRPVSGSEHLFSHVWEMEDLSVNGVPVTHGHKVTIGTLAATAFTEIFFENPDGPPPPPKDYRRPLSGEREAEASAAFAGSRAREGVVKTAAEKLMDEKTAEAINGRFRGSWKEIREKILAQILPYGKLREMLLSAGCPVTPGETGLTRERVIATARRAQMIRSKYSILDLAWDMGSFDAVIKKMEASGVYLR